MNEPPSKIDAASKPAPRVRALVDGALGPLIGLLLVVVFFSIADFANGGRGFTTVRNLRVVLAYTSPVAVAALGMTIIIIAGGIDLSAGAAFALCATVLAFCVNAGSGITVAILAALATGCLCGMINGMLISLLRVVPFIVTLGTMTVFMGVGKLIAKSTAISTNKTMPDWLKDYCSVTPPHVVWGVFPSIPMGVWVAVLLALGVALILRYSVFGRHVFALGSNESTARLCGVNVPMTKIAAYTFAGLFVGIAGLYHIAVYHSVNPASDGKGMELDFIAAVVIGGGSLSGGRGSVLGTLAGAAIMTVIRSGCTQLGVRNPYQDIIIGAIIIAAVTIDQIRQRRSND